MDRLDAELDEHLFEEWIRKIVKEKGGKYESHKVKT